MNLGCVVECTLCRSSYFMWKYFIVGCVVIVRTMRLLLCCVRDVLVGLLGDSGFI
jgi:hypothetical protein